jgi:aspartyl/glutamyl-tRNA(Asn/Gln) amidotransferase C subunit
LIDIREYEAMAMLDMPADERDRLSIAANVLTEGFSALDDISADGIEPLVTVIDRHNVLREDIAEKIITRDELLSNAPEQYDGYFQVPGTLD